MPQSRAMLVLSPRYAVRRNTGDHRAAPEHNDLQVERGFSARFSRRCWAARSFETRADRTRNRTRASRVCGFRRSRGGGHD